MDYSKFESLGDNCEFGFFLRRKNCEISSFFRWVVTSPHALINFVNSEGDNLYKIDNIFSRKFGMVFDKHTDLLFHSKIWPNSDNLIEGQKIDELQLSTYTDEAAKLEFQRRKFFAQLRRDKKIYVVKRNDGLSLVEKDSIVRALAKCGLQEESFIFFIDKSDNQNLIGTVSLSDRNILTGYIGDFADYSSADNLQVDQWDILTKLAYQIAFPSD